MTEVIQNGTQDMQTWIDAFEGKEVNWDALFAKYADHHPNHALTDLHYL